MCKDKPCVLPKGTPPFPTLIFIDRTRPLGVKCNLEKCFCYRSYSIFTVAARGFGGAAVLARLRRGGTEEAHENA